jgi:uncharacterized membrane protein
VGTFSLLGFFIRFIFNKNKFASKQVLVAFRQSILLSVLVVVALFLQSLKLVSWWNLLILITFLTSGEIFFISRDNIIGKNL